MQFVNKKINKDNLLIDDTYNNIFDTFNKRLFRYCLVTIFLLIVMELFFFLGYVYYHLLPLPMYEYLIRFMVRPFLLNMSIYMLAKIIYDKVGKMRIKSIIAMNCFVLIITIIVNIHGYFIPILITFAIPILLACVYGNSFVEHEVFYFTFICAISSYIHIYFCKYIDVDDKYLFNIAIMIMVLIVCHIVSFQFYQNEEYKEELYSKNVLCNSKLEEELKYDGLTNLYNYSVLVQEIEHSLKKNEDMGVAIIDVDFFKNVNDTYGHEVGNDVLIELSRCLKEIENDEILVSRYGGEEFAIIFKNKTLDKCVEILENLRIKIEHIKFEKMNDNGITISCGVTKNNGLYDVMKLLECADKNLYYAKEHGRNQVKA